MAALAFADMRPQRFRSTAELAGDDRRGGLMRPAAFSDFMTRIHDIHELFSGAVDDREPS